MTAIWSRKAKYERWLEVEVAVCEAWAEAGVVPKEDLAQIRERAAFSLERSDEIEKETRHDLMAFVRNVSEEVSKGGSAASRWIHYGLTSYDVIDTSLGMMLRDSCDVLLKSSERLGEEMARLFERYGQEPCIGRTHGIHAEPITFGHKVQGWYLELERSKARLRAARDEVAVGKISGAVGIHAHAGFDLERKVCEALELSPDPNSTQIVARDRMANLLCVLAVFAGSLERVATELRNLQRTEILEVQEAFASGQTGSSAMPHKRNPWNSETVCGLARVVRANAHAMLESIMTWHERDLSSSSVERIILPDTFHLVDFMLARLTTILSGLHVDSERMIENIRLMGDLVFSEHLMMALIEKGMSREAAYKVAQRHASAAWSGNDFRASVAADPEVAALLAPEELESAMNLGHHLRNAPKELGAGRVPCEAS
ncbi:MAG: adenylosuccinate lyase [Fimbriimonadaceae bacterium]|nr:adenylosuccinate lyase [Fimbriimonadaceae bacterium]